MNKITYTLLTSILAAFLCLSAYAYSPARSVAGAVAGSVVQGAVVVAEEAAEPTTYDGFKIKISHSNWVELSQINMTDHDDNEFFVSLTALTELQATTYAQVSAGEFATDSTYGSNTSREGLNNGTPDITNPTSSTIGVEWSTTNSSGIEIYVKPATAKSLKLLDMAMINSYGDPISGVTVTDGDDNVLTPTTSPDDINDVYQTTGNAARNWYRWTFPANP